MLANRSRSVPTDVIEHAVDKLNTEQDAQSSRQRQLAANADARAVRARVIDLAMAIKWQWHQDRDVRVRFAMAARLPVDGLELAALLYDSDEAVCAMAHSRSDKANFDKACLDERWQVRQVGVARTKDVHLVRNAREDSHPIVRETARRRLQYGVLRPL